MAQFAILYALCPGTEVWILARIYDDARSEREYLENFFQSIFYPFSKHLYTTSFDSKSGEWTLKTRWGSEVKIKSAKAQGSITGRELDAILVAEPGWVQEDIYNHIRARLSSRLGRIIALGTPQGMGGFISRMVYTMGRDPKTGKIKRLTPEDRLLENGADWAVSALIFNLSPDDNPAYVKAELAAARQELSDEEYASEFEGKMVSGSGMKFHCVKMGNLVDIPRDKLADCDWVLGVDQGQKNFGACLMGLDGENIYIAKDYFEGDFKTIRTNLIELRNSVPLWIRSLGGDPSRWRLTIFDMDPPIQNTLRELEEQRLIWPTDITYRHDNKKKNGITDDWRKDTTIFINEMAKQQRLLFSYEVSQLHDEIMRTEDVPGNPEFLCSVHSKIT